MNVFGAFLKEIKEFKEVKEVKGMEKLLELEKAELTALINKGVTFEVEDTEFKRQGGLLGLMGRLGLGKRRAPVKVRKKFEIKQPTLGTLDRMAAEWIEVVIDEAVLTGKDGMQTARRLVAKHALRCAKIIAFAVLDADYLIPKHAGNGVARYEEDTRQLDELTALFARTITPSQLYQLCTLITAVSNLGDFMNSIRLMSADRSTMPNRIEGNNGD